MPCGTVLASHPRIDPFDFPPALMPSLLSERFVGRSRSPPRCGLAPEADVGLNGPVFKRTHARLES